MPEVRRRLVATDVKLKREYEDRLLLRSIDVEHYFKAGDLILVKQLKVGKLLPKSTGPYQFLRYKGPLRATAVVKNAQGCIYEFAAGHLLPAVPGTVWPGGEIGREQAAPSLSEGDPEGVGGDLLTPQ